MVKNQYKREENQRLNNKWSKLAKHYNTKYVKEDLKSLYFKKVNIKFWMILNIIDSLASLLYLTKTNNFSYFKTSPYNYKCHCSWCTNFYKRNQYSTRINLNQNLENII